MAGSRSEAGVIIVEERAELASYLTSEDDQPTRGVLQELEPERSEKSPRSPSERAEVQEGIWGEAYPSWEDRLLPELLLTLAPSPFLELVTLQTEQFTWYAPIPRPWHLEAPQ